MFRGIWSSSNTTARALSAARSTSEGEALAGRMSERNGAARCGARATSSAKVVGWGRARREGRSVVRAGRKAVRREVSKAAAADLSGLLNQRFEEASVGRREEGDWSANQASRIEV